MYYKKTKNNMEKIGILSENSQDNLLSIIIPTYNEENDLPCLLESIKRQSGVNFEIIVADNDSKDKTQEIALSYGAKVVKGGLPAQGRNNGAASARGNILVFFDADVILPTRDFLQKCLIEFKSRNLGIATCVIRPISERKIDRIFHKAANLYIKVSCKIVPHIPGCCIFIDKRIHQEILGFDETLKLAEDHDYAKRATKKSTFGILKAYPIFVSVRRLEKDGRVKIALKYFLCEAYMQLIGPIKSDIFNYQFGFKENDEDIIEAKKEKK